MHKTELGKQSTFHNTRNPDHLLALPRLEKRLEIGMNPKQLPFTGFDCWNHYEVSWLNAKGKPVVATAEINYDCRSKCIVESKSLKLYFNSLNNTHFNNLAELQSTVQTDLEQCLQTSVQVLVTPLSAQNSPQLQASFEGTCIDDLDVECSVYTVNRKFLSTDDNHVSETLYSNLLRSNCLVTNQPDWGSVQIEYTGKQIDRAGLLKYLVSYRNHNEFHEQCIERIFMDITSQCQPEQLTVYGRYTRRGGIDINPLRSSNPVALGDLNYRLLRQ